MSDPVLPEPVTIEKAAVRGVMIKDAGAANGEVARACFHRGDFNRPETATQWGVRGDTKPQQHREKRKFYAGKMINAVFDLLVSCAGW